MTEHSETEKVKKIYDELLYVQTRELLNHSPNHPEFQGNTVVSYFNRLSWGLHWQCLCIIANDYKFEGEDRYELLENLNKTNQSKTLAKYGLKIIGEMPDIVDVEKKFTADLKISFCENSNFSRIERERRLKLAPETHLWLFNYNGMASSEVIKDLTKTQIDFTKNQILNVKRALENYHFWDLYKDVRNKGDKSLHYKPSTMWDTQGMDDLNITESMSYSSELKAYYKANIIGWKEIKELPKIPESHVRSDQFIEYKNILLGLDAKEIILQGNIDMLGLNQKLKEYIISDELLFVNGPSEIEGRINVSIFETLLEGKELNSSQTLSMGIGLKGVKQKFSCSSKIEDYSTSNKTPTPKKYHKWIEEEVQGLSEISIPGVKKIPIAEPQTEVDVLGKECFDKIYDLLAKTKAYKLISKFENTMAKLSSYSSNSHDDLIIIPIKITTIDNNTVFYGVLIKSHSHLRSDNDRVNVLTIEFLKEFKEDFKIKYPKHNIFKFKNQNLFLAVRLNATWPLKMFYHSTSKRSIIPIINGVNRVWFSHMAKEQKYSELDTTMNVEMSEGTISFSDWIRRIFSIHVQMAIGNDSQLEAFCADIRRMQMFTRVLQSSESHLYILKGGKPENKVAESVINNPLVLYLKEAWNHHCEGFNEEIKLRVQNAEKNRSLKRQASNSDGRAASTSKT